jgi:hypothetical protein
MNHPVISTTILILLINIAAAPIQANPVEASTSQIRDCKFLGQVEGLSGYGKNIRWQPVAKAKANAKRKAESLGATHVEYTQITTIGSFNGAISARAYLRPN